MAAIVIVLWIPQDWVNTLYTTMQGHVYSNLGGVHMLDNVFIRGDFVQKSEPLPFMGHKEEVILVPSP